MTGSCLGFRDASPPLALRETVKTHIDADRAPLQGPGDEDSPLHVAAHSASCLHCVCDSSPQSRPTLERASGRMRFTYP